jgi:hypothetical protein
MKLNKAQQKQLEDASCKGKRVKFVYPETGETWSDGRVVDEIENIGGHYKSVLQQIDPGEKYPDGSRFGYRFGYYVYSAKVKRVIWAQRPLLASAKEFQDLLDQARAKGWDII